MRSKKLLAFVLVASMMLSAVSVQAKTTENGEDAVAEAVETIVPDRNNSKDSSESSDEKLTEITKTVKSKIAIPEELTEFDYEYYGTSGDGEACWSLAWNDDQRSIRVDCDDKGRIISYNVSDTNEKYRYETRYKKSQLQEKAEKFLITVIPESVGKIRFVDSNFQGVYGGMYLYTYERMENGIPLSENTIEVAINYDTGQITSLRSNWEYSLSIPSEKIMISEEEANEKIKEKLNMEISYRSSYVMTKDGQNKEKIFLAYSPNSTSFAVDAKSGELYTTKGNKGSGMGNFSEDAVAEAGRSGGISNSKNTSLTEKEIKKIDEIADVLSAKEAVETVKKDTRLLQSEDATIVTTRLYQRKAADGGNNAYEWEINMFSPKWLDDKTGYGYYTHIRARVDAKTGKILSYFTTRKNESNYDTVPIFTEEAAAKQMESFAKSQIPDYFKQCVPIKVDTADLETYKSTKTTVKDKSKYSYQYSRTYKDIPYQGNGIYGAVDSETGKIFDFSYDWDEDASFEEPENIIAAEVAEDSYLNFSGIRLLYEINWKGTKPEVRLVYRAEIKPMYVSPFTGNQLNYDGTEYKKGQNYITYNDIGDSPARDSIELLADMGIGFPSGQFLPKQAIKMDELKEMTDKTQAFQDTSRTLETWSAWGAKGEIVTRLDAAKYCIMALGLNQAAIVPETYQITYEDKDEIPEEDIGYVALAKGMKLIIGDSENYFNPDDPFTREEAAELIIKMMSRS